MKESLCKIKMYERDDHVHTSHVAYILAKEVNKLALIVDVIIEETGIDVNKIIERVNEKKNEYGIMLDEENL